MLHRKRSRLSLFAAGLALASCMPLQLQAQDKSPTPTDPAQRSAQSEGRQVTMSGKIVDLYQHMTGEKAGRDTPGQTRPGDRPQPNLIDPADRDDVKPRIDPVDPKNRPGAVDRDAQDPQQKNRPQPGDRDATTPGAAGRDNAAQAHMKKNQIMGLDTGTGLVIIYMKDAPSVFATPRTDTPDADTTRPAPPRPGATPRPGANQQDNQQDDKDRLTAGSDQDRSKWLNKQVQVTGTMYEKDGIKFLVVNKIDSSGTTTPGATDRPDATLPGTPRPGTSPGKPRE